MKPTCTGFSDDGTSSKCEAVASEDACGVEGELLERDLGVGKPGGQSQLEVVRAEGRSCTKPEGAGVSGAIPCAQVRHIDARVAGLCVCDELLELVDGVAKLTGGHF